MATTKISVSVDRDVLANIKRLGGADVNVSSIVDEALRARLARLEISAVLEEWENVYPISDEGHKAGDALWQQAHG